MVKNLTKIIFQLQGDVATSSLIELSMLTIIMFFKLINTGTVWGCS